MFIVVPGGAKPVKKVITSIVRFERPKIINYRLRNTLTPSFNDILPFRGPFQEWEVDTLYPTSTVASCARGSEQVEGGPKISENFSGKDFDPGIETFSKNSLVYVSRSINVWLNDKAPWISAKVAPDERIEFSDVFIRPRKS